MKKILALMLVASMLIGCLVGCGEKPASDSSDSGSAPPASASSSPAEPADDGVLNLTDKEMAITLWDISTDDTMKGLCETAYENFMKDHPNIKIDYQHIVNDTYKEQLLIAMGASQCPDAYIHWTGGPMQDYCDAGYCDDITALYEKYNKVTYLDSAIEMCKNKDGQLIALPYGGMSGTVLYYNKTLFGKLGLKAPTTIAELEACAEALKTAGYIPLSCANASKWTGSLYYMYLVARFGGPEAVAKAYSGEGKFDDQPFVKAAAKIQEWVKKGYFPEGVNSIAPDNGDDRKLLYTEKAGMMVQLSSSGGNIKKEASDWYYANLAAVPFPIDEESEKAGINQKVAVGSAVGNAFSFNTKGDEEKLKALFVLLNQYMTSDEYVKGLQDNSTKIFPIQGAEKYVKDSVPMATYDLFNNASQVQLFYDQYLPGAVAEVHKDSMIDLFGLTKTPEDLCKDLSDAWIEYQKENS